jgi:DNA-binding transcriptional ArsR family regulator
MQSPDIDGAVGRRATAEHLQAVIGSWTRQAVLVGLSGPRRTAGDLATVLELARNVVSNHTSALEACGLARMEREGSFHYWSLTAAVLIAWEPAGLLIELSDGNGARLSQFLPYAAPEMRLLAAAARAAGCGHLMETKPRRPARAPGTPDHALNGTHPTSGRG